MILHHHIYRAASRTLDNHLKFVFIQVHDDGSASATAATGFCLATVPVTLEDGDVPGFVEASSIERIFRRLDPTPHQRWPWQDAPSNEKPIHVRLEEKHIVDLNDPLALSYRRSYPPKATEWPNYSHLLPPRSVDTPFVRHMAFNPAYFADVVAAVRPINAHRDWAVRLSRSHDTGAILIEATTNRPADELARPYGLLMPLYESKYVYTSESSGEQLKKAQAEADAEEAAP